MRTHVFILPLMAAFGLSGCLGSGGGGGAAVGGGAAPAPAPAPGGGAFATELARVQALNPTLNMPTTINATYRGQAQADLSDGGAVPVGQATADLNLSLNWTDGGPMANVWSGNASNLRGTVNGTNFTSTGSIPVNGAISGVTRTPGLAGVVLGGLSVSLAGNMDIDDGTGPQSRTVGLGLGGNFYGNNAVAMTGPANLTINGPAVGGAAGNLIGVGGQFYAEQ
ncbi:MAG: hypothetical protein O2898_10095 [Proteobacteria bacterium]|nr:hypothetical protein [Pseudomonadota bacterium]